MELTPSNRTRGGLRQDDVLPGRAVAPPRMRVPGVIMRAIASSGFGDWTHPDRIALEGPDERLCHAVALGARLTCLNVVHPDF